MTAAHATGAASTGAATTVVDLELSLAPDHREETEPPAPAEQTTGQSGEASPGPSVTAIEFDLGELVTAYPSARPGAAGPISGVGITVHVTDLARSAEFYRDLLGFYEIDGGDGSLVLASGNTRVVLREVHDAAGVDGRLVHINLEVADVQAMYEELVAKRVRFTYDPRPTSRGERLELWAAEFHDPDGHRIAITQWRARGDAQP
jgi:catechol 2,3-dioxygenase-like lactoylglutathione lyase family enzyme